MYNNEVGGRGWGLWINPNGILHWSESSKTWDLNNLGTLNNNASYKLIITFLNNIYSFDLINLGNNTQKREKIQKESDLITNKGFVTFGGRWMNTSEPFQGTFTSIELEIDKIAYDNIFTQETTSPLTQPPTITKAIHDGCMWQWQMCNCRGAMGTCQYGNSKSGLYCRKDQYNWGRTLWADCD
jgi:hypothetical protein